MECEEFYCYCPVCGELVIICYDLNYEAYCSDCGWIGFAYQTNYIKHNDEYLFEEENDDDDEIMEE